MRFDSEVTAENAAEYVQAKVHYTLVGARKESLAALKKGFESIRIGAHLQLFSATEVAMLKMALNQSALQHSVLGVWNSALDMPWIQVLCQPCLKENDKLVKLAPTAHFE